MKGWSVVVLCATVAVVAVGFSAVAMGKSQGDVPQSLTAHKQGPSFVVGSDGAKEERKEKLGRDNMRAYAPELAHAIDALPEEAKAQALAALEEMNVPAVATESLKVDGNGHFFYADSFPSVPERKRRSAEEEDGEEVKERVRRYFSENPPTGTGPDGIPYYHSKPNSINTLFLDFNGHQQPFNTAWGSFNALPYDQDGDTSSFSAGEISDMLDVYSRVSEFYAPFNIDVTTEQPADFQNRRTLHALITRNKQADGSNMPSHNAGGIAYVGIFLSNDIAYSSPALIYYNNAGNYPSGIAQVVAHECGHNFGLSHDGLGNQEYHPGVAGTTNYNSWGPVMGAPYDIAVVQWSKGEYSGATNTEDDFAIISGQTTYSSDPNGDTTQTSLPVEFPGGAGTQAFRAEGVINKQDDIDYWHILVGSSGTLSVTATPFYGATGYGGNSLDIILELHDSNDNMVARSAPSGTSTASLSASVSAGTYYIVVDGGYDSAVITTDYGSAGQYKLTGTLSSGGVSTTPHDTTSTTTVITTTEATTTTPCTSDDTYEDNDVYTSPSQLTVPVTISDLYACSNDDDWYIFTLDCDALVSVSLTFTGEDIDTYLYRVSDYQTVGSGTSGTDNEYFEAIVSSGDYLLLVYGYDGAAAPYAMSIDVQCGVTTVTTTAAPCVDDDLEDNDVYQDATQLTLPESLSSLVACPNDDDWYVFDVCDGGFLEIALTFFHAVADIDMELFELASGNRVDSSTSGTDNEYIGYQVPSGAGGTYYLVVYGYQGATGPYDMDVSVSCVACTDDAFEDNDDYTASYQLTIPGSFPDLFICPNDDDWFIFNVDCDTSIVGVTITFSNAVGDLDIAMYEYNSGSLVASSFSGTDNEYISYFVPSGHAGYYYLVVYGYQGASAPYDLIISLECDATTTTSSGVTSTGESTTRQDTTSGISTTSNQCTDDAFEDNDDYTASYQLTIPGSFPDLFICPNDDDWFIFNVDCDTSVVGVTITFSGAVGDLDIAMYEYNSGSLVARSFSATDNEYISYFVPSGHAGYYYLYVYGYQGASAPYDLIISLECDATTTTSSGVTSTGESTTRQESTPLTTVSTTTSCTDDAFEDNDVFDDASQLSPSSFGDLTVCPNDDDWYQFEACENGVITVEILFSHSVGDLDMRLFYDPTQFRVAKSTSSTDNELITYVVPSGEAGTYYIRVYGFNGASAPYELSILVDCPTTSTTTMAATTTTADPCDGTFNKPSRKKCKRACQNNGYDTFTFYSSAEDAGFVGCTQPHCECRNYCDGVNPVATREECANTCADSGMGFLYYTDAADAGYTGCHLTDCECTADVCAGVWSIGRKKCKRKCNGNFNYYTDAADAGFPLCHEHHCECVAV